MRTHLIFVLILTAVILRAQPAATYKDPGGRFALQQPAGWKATQLNRDAVQFASAMAYATVMVLPGPDPALFLNAIGKQAGGQWRGFAEARRGDVQLAGHTGPYVTYAGTNPSGADAYLQLMAVSERGSTYLLMFSAPKAEFTRLKAAFDQIEQSLQLIAPADTSDLPPAPAGAVKPPPRAPAAAPAPPQAAASARGAAPTTNANYYRMKKVSIRDDHGFERPMTALSMLIPTDWQIQGGAQYATKVGCHPDVVQLAFRATSPDGRTGVEMFPGKHWQWADDAGTVRLLQQQNQQRAQFGGQGCDVMPAMNAADYLRRNVIPRVRPNARVTASDPLPEFTQQVQERARQLESMAGGQGIRVRVTADVARLRVEYQAGGQGVEEWMTAVTFATGMPGPSFNIATGRMGQTMYYSCEASVLFGLRAPQGQLPGMEKFFLMMLSTAQLDPAWQARVTQTIANLQATDSRGAQQRSAIIAQNGRDISNIINEGYASRSKMQDNAAAGFDQYIRGVQTYKNPATGETVELSNQYGYAWANGNEYILTDSAGFNPNVTLRSGNWTEMQAVRH